MGPVTKPLTLAMEHSAIMLYEVDANCADELHEHEQSYQISIPLIGKPLVQCNRDIRHLTGEERLVFSPHYRHRHFAQDEAIRMMLIFFDLSFLQKVFQDKTEAPYGPIEFTPWARKATDRFRRLAETACLQTITHPLEKVELEEIEWNLASLLLGSQEGSHTQRWQDSSRQSALAKSPNHPVLKRISDYIQDDLTADSSLDALATLAGVSKFHLIRLFREHMGLTPAQYISDIRTQRADWLLRHTTMDITAIAYEVGFGSLSAFERAFKKKQGISPHQYRKSLQS